MRKPTRTVSATGERTTEATCGLRDGANRERSLIERRYHRRVAGAVGGAGRAIPRAGSGVPGGAICANVPVPVTAVQVVVA